MSIIRKAVIPAAGMGTRFLPATKSMPKEMLPIVDKPVIQYVIEEAIASGLDDILIITGRTKRSIENHFDYNPELESFLDEAGKGEMVAEIRELADQANIHYIRQKTQAGLGDAIRHARMHVGNEPFAVLLGDTIIDSSKQDAEGESIPGLRHLIDAYDKKESSVVAVHEVPHEWVSRYGIVDGVEDSAYPDLYRLNRLIEKPSPEHAPTNLAIAGRYIFTPDIFDYLDRTSEGHGGEIQLTDAMNMQAADIPTFALKWKAHRYDIGNRVEYVKCFLDYALRRKDMRDGVMAYLKEVME